MRWVCVTGSQAGLVTQRGGQGRHLVGVRRRRVAVGRRVPRRHVGVPQVVIPLMGRRLLLLLGLKQWAGQTGGAVGLRRIRSGGGFRPGAGAC